MAGTSDAVFLRAFKWFQAAVARLQTELPSGPPADLAGPLTDILRTRLGLQLDKTEATICLLYTSPSPRDLSTSRMPSSA